MYVKTIRDCFLLSFFTSETIFWTVCEHWLPVVLYQRTYDPSALLTCFCILSLISVWLEKTNVLFICTHKRVKSIVFSVFIKCCDESSLAILRGCLQSSSYGEKITDDKGGSSAGATGAPPPLENFKEALQLCEMKDKSFHKYVSIKICNLWTFWSFGLLLSIYLNVLELLGRLSGI